MNGMLSGWIYRRGYVRFGGRDEYGPYDGAFFSQCFHNLLHLGTADAMNAVPTTMLEPTVILNEGRHLIVGGHEVGTAMLGDQDRATGIA
jgi:hypothetical protein